MTTRIFRTIKHGSTFHLEVTLIKAQIYINFFMQGKIFISSACLKYFRVIFLYIERKFSTIIHRALLFIITKYIFNY